MDSKFGNGCFGYFYFYSSLVSHKNVPVGNIIYRKQGEGKSHKKIKSMGASTKKPCKFCLLFFARFFFLYITGDNQFSPCNNFIKSDIIT